MKALLVHVKINLFAHPVLRLPHRCMHAEQKEGAPTVHSQAVGMKLMACTRRASGSAQHAMLSNDRFECGVVVENLCW